MRRRAGLLLLLLAAACKPSAKPKEDPARCATCHTQESWHPSTFRHPWPLTGAHAKTRCSLCHQGKPPKFHGTPKQCFGCHRPDYERAPDHAAGKRSTKCEECHQTTAWSEGHPKPGEPRSPAPSAAPSPPKAPAPPRPDVTSQASPPW